MRDPGVPAEEQSFPDRFFSKLSAGSWLDSLPIGIYFCDPDGVILQYNRRAADLWGRVPRLGEDEQRFCGAHKLFLIDGSILPFEQTPMADVLRTRIPVRDETVTIERPDGTRLTALVNIDPIFTEDGTFQGAVNCFQDITELKRAQACVEAKERELHTLLRSLPAAIYRTDAEGRIIFFNQAAVELAGRRPEIGKEKWCISWRLHSPDGRPLPHDQCPMAIALKEQRPIRGAEIVVERPDGRKVPCLASPTPLFDDEGNLTGAVNMIVDISERKQAENHQKLLIAELNHRVKNTLATVQSIANQTLRRARNPSHFVEGLTGRLQAMAQAHTTITQNSWRGADLTELLRGQLLLAHSDTDRISCAGPLVMLEAQPALHLALVLHELGTNARKHGALSAPNGRVAVGWVIHTNGGRELIVTWKETGGPPVVVPEKAGFGTTLIRKSLEAHGGGATVLYEANGLKCEIRLPLPEDLRPHARSMGNEGLPGHLSATGQRSTVVGKRILLVEDEPLVALDIDSILQQAGCVVLGPVATIDRAMQRIEHDEIDIALLDANLSGRPVDELAAALTRRNIPFAFVTGYGRDGLPQSFHDALMIAKPFEPETLLNTVAQLIEPTGAIPLRQRPAKE